MARIRAVILFLLIALACVALLAVWNISSIGAQLHETHTLPQVHIGGSERTKEKAIAVFIVGTPTRLLLRSKLELLDHLAQTGYSVDFYIKLMPTNATRYREATCFREEQRGVHDLGTFARDLLEKRGGKLQFFDISAVNALEIVAPNHLRTKEYSDSEKRAVVMRRYYAVTALMEQMIVHERESHMTYEAVVWSKDDEHWFGPPLIDEMMKLSGFNNTVLTKACKQFKGVNDKTLIFGREAAQRVLPHLVSQLQTTSKKFKTRNTEDFVSQVLQRMGVASRPVPVDWIPTADSFYQSCDGELVLCQMSYYYCDFPASFKPAQTPRKCKKACSRC
eukprot:TRINITY_DN7828_c0_g1_i1.p1 TRINITY_DN7828_c0_g1~~TRINITY_DN7828_c0_g1_i1.p1  ORF type:complete len:353 (-),score=40.03 TRINITY_DN7828_c0_g1_i1:465-1469(-)